MTVTIFNPGHFAALTLRREICKRQQVQDPLALALTREEKEGGDTKQGASRGKRAKRAQEPNDLAWKAGVREATGNGKWKRDCGF